MVRILTFLAHFRRPVRAPRLSVLGAILYAVCEKNHYTCCDSRMFTERKVVGLIGLCLNEQSSLKQAFSRLSELYSACLANLRHAKLRVKMEYVYLSVRTLFLNISKFHTHTHVIVCKISKLLVLSLTCSTFTWDFVCQTPCIALCV